MSIRAKIFKWYKTHHYSMTDDSNSKYLCVWKRADFFPMTFSIQTFHIWRCLNYQNNTKAIVEQPDGPDTTYALSVTHCLHKSSEHSTFSSTRHGDPSILRSLCTLNNTQSLIIIPLVIQHKPMSDGDDPRVLLWGPYRTHYRNGAIPLRNHRMRTQRRRHRGHNLLEFCVSPKLWM